MVGQERFISYLNKLQARANPLRIKEPQELGALLGVLDIDGQGFSLAIEFHLDEFDVYLDVLTAEFIQGVDSEMHVAIAVEE
jgi:hypothetical protein